MTAFILKLSGIPDQEAMFAFLRFTILADIAQVNIFKILQKKKRKKTTCNVCANGQKF